MLAEIQKSVHPALSEAIDVQPISTSAPLRPLGLGELLDRAVTLCVKHFVVLALVGVVILVPLGVSQFFGFADQSKFFGALNDMAQASASGKSVPDADIQKMFQPSAFNGWTAFWFLLFMFGAPLMSGAIVAAVSSIYLGGVASFKAAYATALKQWGHLLLLNLMFIVLAFIAYMIVVVIGIVVTLGIIAIAAASKGLAIGVGVVVGLVFLVALIAAALVGFLAWQMSFIACVVERANFVTAFASGLKRIFGSVGFKRAILVGLAYFAISFGIGLVATLGAGVLYGVARSHVLGESFTVLVQLASNAFVTTFITIFYFDLRVREEGLDLQLAAGSVVPGDALTTA